MAKYKPPFQMDERIATLTAQIAEKCGQISVLEGAHVNPVLRRQNRIRTIYSSLAIEQNTLSLNQVTDVINGKRVLASPADIKEVKNAYEIYEKLDQLNPYRVEDLLTAHGVMTKDLIKESGVFRSSNVGVYANGQLIHAGTPAKYVPDVIEDLFAWLKDSELHPLVKSCVFHYEFEFIHPFADGNGRMGRLWQTLILSKWQPFFAWLPVESMIHDDQQGYYNALGSSDNMGDANGFVIYILELIRKVLEELQINTDISEYYIGSGYAREDVVDSYTAKTGTVSNAEKILAILKEDPRLSAVGIAGQLGVSSRQVERIIKDLRESGKLVRHGAARGGYWEVR